MGQMWSDDILTLRKIDAPQPMNLQQLLDQGSSRKLHLQVSMVEDKSP